MADDIIETLQAAVADFDAEAAGKITSQAIEADIDPLHALESLTETIRLVGERFQKGDIFLPELIAAAEAMTASTTLLEAEIKRQGKVKQSVGKVVIGTVHGDIHDIGKNIVATLMRAAGYDVYDCGVNVQAEAFVGAVRDEASDVLALSALLTTTAPEQAKVIKALEETGMRKDVHIIVGGGGITQKFAEEIGADGYAANAAGAVDLVKGTLGK